MNLMDHLKKAYITSVKLTSTKPGMPVIIQKPLLRGKVVTTIFVAYYLHIVSLLLISVETTTSYMRSVKDIFNVFMKDRRKHRKLQY